MAIGTSADLWPYFNIFYFIKIYKKFQIKSYKHFLHMTKKAVKNNFYFCGDNRIRLIALVAYYGSDQQLLLSAPSGEC